MGREFLGAMHPSEMALFSSLAALLLLMKCVLAREWGLMYDEAVEVLHHIYRPLPRLEE